MSIIDFVLNLVCLMIWLNWRATRLDPLARASATTLVGTLKRADPHRLKLWHVLSALPVLLLLRAWIYWKIGSAVDWTPRLDLGVVALPFRSDLFRTSLWFSLLSFIRTLLIFYCWMLVLSAVNRKTAAIDPILRMIRLQLGRVADLPAWVQLLIPLILVAGLWAAFQPLLIQTGITNRAHSNLHLLERCLLIGVSIYFSLKYLLPAILLVHLIGSYVYLGSNPLWTFVGTTSRNLLAPLNQLPLRFRKLDLAPIIGMILILLLLDVLPNLLLRNLLERRLTLWPV
jgi:uncharacterized protein YggT (Ycf19 family)